MWLKQSMFQPLKTLNLLLVAIVRLEETRYNVVITKLFCTLRWQHIIGQMLRKWCTLKRSLKEYNRRIFFLLAFPGAPLRALLTKCIRLRENKQRQVEKVLYSQTSFTIYDRYYVLYLKLREDVSVHRTNLKYCGKSPKNRFLSNFHIL